MDTAQGLELNSPLLSYIAERIEAPHAGTRWCRPTLGSRPAVPRSTNPQLLTGGRVALGTVLRMAPNALHNAVAMSFILVVVRAVVKSNWVAILGTSGVLGVYVLAEAAGAAGENTSTVVLFSVSFVVPIVATLLRPGRSGDS